ncbi:MAG: HU family DNA-binding protein [Candidatus Symbiothrix sp.]|jgi:nucleoid DNA-binding protein|nr:HU family DNA-binding protein [Candidatus Symbiothrix sp.]
MNEKLNIQDLAARLAEKSGITKKDAESFLREFSDTINDALFSDRLVKVKNLGSFKLIFVNDRESIDVLTGQRVLIPAHYKISFLPDNSLSEVVNEPFSFFETIEVSEDEKEEEPQVQEKSVLQPVLPIIAEKEKIQEESILQPIIMKEEKIQEESVLQPILPIITEEEKIQEESILQPILPIIVKEEKIQEKSILQPIMPVIREEIKEENPKIEIEQHITNKESLNYNIPDSDYEFPYSEYAPIEHTFLGRLVRKYGIWNIIFTILFCLVGLGLGYLWWTDNYARRLVYKEYVTAQQTEAPVDQISEILPVDTLSDILPEDVIVDIIPVKDSISNKPIKKESVPEIKSVQLAEKKPEPNATKPTESIVVKPIKTEKTTNIPSEKLDQSSSNSRSYVVKNGETLRLIALAKYGDKAFWVYIYEENKARIKNPNSVSVGMVLNLPPVEKYGIDATDPESIRKANRRSEQIK